MSQMNQGFVRGDAAVIGPQAEALLEQGEFVTLQVSGDSMRPILKPRRDAVVLAPIEEWPPKRGDILFFKTPRSQSGYSLHRVYRLTPEGPIMNGDSQQWVEGPIGRDQVIAKAVILLRKGGPYDTEKRSYRVYVSLWRYTRPFRHAMFAVWRGLKRFIKG